VTGPPDGELAGVVSRFASFFIDAALLVAVETSAVVVILLTSAVTAIGTPDRGLADTTVRLVVAGLPLLFACYATVFWALVGRTPGMALLGIRLVTVAGRPVRWWSALLRAALLICFPVGALWCVVDRHHQAVHDKIARTAVVRMIREPTRLLGGA
jgi:uncharacterized RDD family membrane protein YckC